MNPMNPRQQHCLAASFATGTGNVCFWNRSKLRCKQDKTDTRVSVFQLQDRVRGVTGPTHAKPEENYDNQTVISGLSLGRRGDGFVKAHIWYGTYLKIETRLFELSHSPWRRFQSWAFQNSQENKD